LTEPRAEPSTGFRELLETVWRRIDREELACLAQELVRIPSVYRPEEAEGNEERVARFLADYLEREGFEVQTEEVAPGRRTSGHSGRVRGRGRPYSSRRTPTW
jgi:acetylornithine deacetylase/succinyl-diaminopimelate desuccinylase-like protein